VCKWPIFTSIIGKTYRRGHNRDAVCGRNLDKRCELNRSAAITRGHMRKEVGIMGLAVVMGASILCTMGSAPGTLNVTSQTKVIVDGKPAATIQDTAPMVNVGPCGVCTSMANPAVASATAAAMGVLTPMPCVPAPAGIWMGGKTPFVGGKPGLSNDAKLLCTYGGNISIMNPGQTKVIYS
jgi:hypothetical protein